jgi:hypothetical protein
MLGDCGAGGGECVAWSGHPTNFPLNSDSRCCGTTAFTNTRSPVTRFPSISICGATFARSAPKQVLRQHDLLSSAVHLSWPLSNHRCGHGHKLHCSRQHPDRRLLFTMRLYRRHTRFSRHRKFGRRAEEGRGEGGRVLVDDRGRTKYYVQKIDWNWRLRRGSRGTPQVVLYSPFYVV